MSAARRRSLVVRLARWCLALLCATLLSPWVAAAAADPPIAPKVLVITMFEAEARPWRQAQDFSVQVPVPGLSPDYPQVGCTRAGLCLATTGMGYANAASAIAALVQSDRFDLRDSYVLIAGIGGVDPGEGTLGSAHWARYAIDGGLIHSIDPRQIPADWRSGVVMFGASRPGQPGKWKAGTELYRLDEALLQRAYRLSVGTALRDSAAAQAYRARYPAGPGRAPPAVSICDTLSGDTYWHGSLTAQALADYVTLATAGSGRYCTTQMEDNATLTALRRGAEAGRLRFARIALLRTGSNFDREAPAQTAADSMLADSGGFALAVDNAYRVGNALAAEIVGHWEQWRIGVPR
ncbi:purine nucleoside permease [Xanthomonas hyacinthi]|uniref:Purine nucleoside permease n=2 Tax=Xanthomonas hyacinthi TaxID=56455 RepID=A0A2S7F0I0_9XANT|nr:purine nucleoside permease [Xanthomonas hyacinthi]PPU98919.1 purine nucleoside permease [Xanthomonas hyacinthi]QGY77754.1 purine nucleoside permease [Xanthomonas hyacinthi]